MKTLKKNSNIIWIHGNLRQCRKVWKSLCQYIEENHGEPPNIQSFTCGFNQANCDTDKRWPTARDVIYALRSKDMFDDRPRITKVIGVPGDYSDFLHYMSIPSPNNLLVFWGKPGYYKPGSKQWASVKNTNLFKQVGRVFESPVEAKSPTEAVKLIIEVCAEEKKDISKEVAREIVRLEGKNLDLLENTAIKLSTYAMKKKITLEDVQACCRTEFLDEVWDFLSYLDRNMTDEALAYLESYFEEKPAVGESFIGRVQKIFGALRQHFLFLLLAQDASPNGFNAVAIEKSVQNFKKVTPSQIAKLKSKEISAEDLPNWFTPGFLRAKSNSSSVTTALKHRKSRTYHALLDLYFCIFMCRKNPSEAYIKLCLNAFVLLACGKITLQEAALVRGHKRKYEV